MLKVLKITGLLHIRSDVPDNLDPLYVNRLSIHDQNIQKNISTAFLECVVRLSGNAFRSFSRLV